MGLRILCVLTLSLISVSAAGRSEPVWTGPWKRVGDLVPILVSVPEGRALLDEALAKDPDVLTKVQPGAASFTESTFARTYSLLDGSERIELRHEVAISSKLPLSEAVVDLAHELVHFTAKEMLDPYKAGFELKEFVRRGIEGPGGELAALEQECLVAWALRRRYPSFPRHRLCAPYQNPEGGFDRERARDDYYAVGSWHGKLSDALKQAVPEISSRRVVFTSSYARTPYPVALAQEFEATREAACANNRRKYRLISAQAEDGRLPASDLLTREKMRLKTYERLYCALASGPKAEK
jgi:hypothetical protein